MAAQKCPLCMGKLTAGECPSCGYRLPDEEDISAIYDYEPDDYPQEQPAMREITPDVQMEEIYPNRPEPVQFKVRDNDGQTIRGEYNSNTANNTNNGNPYANGGNPYANNGNPYANQNGSFQPYQNQNSPFANTPANQFGGTDTETFGTFLAKHWVTLLLTLMIPIVGIVFYAVNRNDIKSSKYHWLVIVLAVLGFILPP